MNINNAMMRIIQDNAKKKFDVTALYHLLKHTCNLGVREAVWKDNTKLEGSWGRFREVMRRVGFRGKLGAKSVKSIKGFFAEKSWEHKGVGCREMLGA